jgi:REP element-mobilizing transposase RayT
MSKLQSGKTYHIYNQGNNKEPLFKETGNYEYFLSKVEKYFLDYFDIYAYCLLNNHFHIVLKMKDEADNYKATRAISNCFNAYAKAINKKYNRTGSLFRDRFRRKEIHNLSYLKNVIVYVSSNAVHHSFKSSIIEWPWSSFHAMEDQNDTILDKVYILEIFDGIENYKTLCSKTDLDLNELE